MNVELNWIKNFGYLAKSGSGHALLMDAPVAAGGNNLGPSPLEVVLMGAAACMSYDIVSILKKSRVELELCTAKLEAERSLIAPTVFTKIDFKFTIKGPVTREQVQRVIDMAAEKYCSVSIMLEKSVAIKYSFELIE